MAQDIGASASPLVRGSVWILNDDVTGTVFQTMKQMNYMVARSVDGGLLSHQGTSRRVLLEELGHSKPDLLVGILKSPATNVGTALERKWFETVSSLLRVHIGAGGKVLMVGRSPNRMLDQPSMKERLESNLRLSHLSWGCLGIKQIETTRAPLC